MERTAVQKHRPYLRVEADMRARIEDGRWLPGAMIPSRKDLALEYGVALTVVERAVAGLLADGTLHAMDRRGTFVAADPATVERNGAHAAKKQHRVTSLGSRESNGQLESLSRFINIGVVTTLSPSDDGTSLVDYWRGIILNSLERTVTNAGGFSSFYNLHTDRDVIVPLREGVEALIAQNVDAIVVIKEDGFRRTAEAAAIAEQNNVPILFILSEDAPPSALAVGYDNREAGYQAGCHLLQRNYTELVFFSPYRAHWVTERLSGVLCALFYAGFSRENLHLAVSEVELSETSGNHEDLAYHAAREFLRGPLPGRAIVAANDHAAYGFIRAADEAGLRLGKDYSLVGFDDLPDSKKIGLTTLHPPLEPLGREAGRLLIRVLNGETNNMQVGLMAHLIARSSSQPIQ